MFERFVHFYAVRDPRPRFGEQLQLKNINLFLIIFESFSIDSNGRGSIFNFPFFSLRRRRVAYNISPFTPRFLVFRISFAGVGVTYSFKNTRTMIAGLESVQESREMIDGGSGFYGIMRACELVPYDSAIFISTDKMPEDVNLVKYAAITLLKKRIRVCYSLQIRH